MISNKTMANVGIASVTSGLWGTARIYDPTELRPVIRDAAHQAGVGDGEVPLSGIIEPGMTVLLKPNWVLDRNEAGHGMECLVTRPGFILAALAEVVAARPARVLIGDSPIQLCVWDKLVTPEFRLEAESIATAAGVALDFVDFRRVTGIDGGMDNGFRKTARGDDRYALFDLGADSLLEPITDSSNRFRITNYDPRTLARTHRPGQHQFLICKEVFEADIVILLPKLKTHRKAGITASLKNLVGVNGSKDYLPHHRIGGVESGGDCYPGRSRRNRFAEFCLDQANRRIGRPGYASWHKLAFNSFRGRFPVHSKELEGSWKGNDTAWRMVLDLNRIALYGGADGTMAETPRRRLYSLTDAIVCGQGEGPLESEPLDVGVVTFASSSACADSVHAALLGLDSQKMALTREAFGRYRWPLTDPGTIPVAHWEGNALTLDEVADSLGKPARVPQGWEGIERVGGVACESPSSRT